MMVFRQKVSKEKRRCLDFMYSAGLDTARGLLKNHHLNGIEGHHSTAIHSLLKLHINNFLLILKKKKGGYI